MLHSISPSPPIPSLAFSEESALLVGELLEGFIWPKKAKESHFFRRRSQSTDEETLRATDSDFCPAPHIRAIIGSKENMEHWLRESGPGSSCLWAQAEEFSLHSRKKMPPSGQLRLSYRLRSDRAFSVPILNGTLLELSLVAPITSSEGMKKWSKTSAHKAMRSESSDSGFWKKQRDVNSMASPSRAPTQGSNRSPAGLGRMATAVAEMDKSLDLFLADKVFKQLLLMVSPGGVLREYQQLLKRVVDSCNFLDVDFQLVDLQKWMTQHPYAIFQEESDVVVVRSDVKGLRWDLLRFDFSDGLIRSTKGATLRDLEVVFGNQNVSEFFATSKGCSGRSRLAKGGDEAVSKHLEGLLKKLQWKTWRTVDAQEGKSCVSPMTLIVADMLDKNDTDSVTETDSLNSLLSLELSLGRECIEVGLADIRTIFKSTKRNGLSSIEKHALSHLRSYSKELRSQGLYVLLHLLTGDEADPSARVDPQKKSQSTSPPIGSSHLNPDTTRSSSIVGLRAEEKDLESSFREKLREESKEVESGHKHSDRDKKNCTRSERRVAMEQQGNEREGGVSRAGSQTDKAEEESWWQLEEIHKGQPTTALMQKTESPSPKCDVGVVQVMEWLNGDFLKVLIDRMMEKWKHGQTHEDILDIARPLTFEAVTEACLKVVELLPGEGTSRLTEILVLSLKQICEDLLKLNFPPQTRGEPDFEINRNPHKEEKNVFTLVVDDIMQSSNGVNLQVQETLGKALEFSKLLYAVTSRSSILAAPLAESGGLDLILDLYACLVKRFPVNLRLGAKSTANVVNKEDTLPGEVVKSQETTLKVLPCLLPSYCICRIAQTCLLDSSTLPQKEKVDLNWTTAEPESLCTLNKLVVESHPDTAVGLPTDEPCSSHIEGLFMRTPESKSKAQIPAEMSGQRSTLPSFTVKMDSDSVGSSEVSHPTYKEKQCLSGAVISAVETKQNSLILPTDLDDGPEKGTSSSGLQRRPHVPPLPLSSILLSSSKLCPPMPGTDKPTKNVVQAPTATTPSCRVPNFSATLLPAYFDIFSAVCTVKFELLQTMASMFASHSLYLCNLKRFLHHKLQNKDKDNLVLHFLPDMIGGFLDMVPEHVGRRTKRMLFQVVSALDKCEWYAGITKITQNPTGCGTEDSQGEALWNDPGPPSFSDGCRRSVDLLLLEIGERLRCLVCDLTEISTKLGVRRGDLSAKQPCTRVRSPECNESLLANRTISSGHVLSLWIDVGLLLRVLGDLLLFWPEKGSVHSILRFCGKPVESVLDLLAGHSNQSNWNFAQILTMQHLLELFTGCMKSLRDTRSSSFPVWSDIDAFFWQLLLGNDSNWTCVKNFASWVGLKSCQACLRKLVEGYQKVLGEPLEIYYSMVGQKINLSRSERNQTGALRELENLRKSIFPFLRLSILLVRKKLKCQVQHPQATPTLYMSRLVFLLDFLMNPVEGLLMCAIRDNVSCGKLSHLQRDADVLNISNRICVPKCRSEKHGHFGPRSMVHALTDTVSSKDSQGLCKKCASKPGLKPFGNRFTTSLKHECLCILADIFSLKAFEQHEEQSNLCINPRAQNPFLFHKYVIPFLEMTYVCFLRLYNDKGEYSECELQLITPSSQGLLGNLGNLQHVSNSQTSEPKNLVEDTFSICDAPWLSNDQDEFVQCSSLRSQEEELTSAACVSYARVLLALAQNQTEDVSQGFKNLRVMDFLVQQIDLEYEASQVATPRDFAHVGRAIVSPLVPAKRQGLDSGDFGISVTRVTLAKSEERCASGELNSTGHSRNMMKASGESNMSWRKRVDSDDETESFVANHSIGIVTVQSSGKQEKDETSTYFTEQSSSRQSSLVSRSSTTTTTTTELKAIPTTPSLFKEEHPMIVTPSQGSEKIALAQKMRNLHSPAMDSCLRYPDKCLGFHSARDRRLTRIHSDGLFLDQPLFTLQGIQLTSTKATNPSTRVPNLLLPFRERDENAMSEERGLSERGTSGTWTSFQRGFASVGRLTWNPKEGNENDVALLSGGHEYLGLHIPSAEKHNASVSSRSIEVETSTSCQGQNTHEKENKTSPASTSTEIKYSGRFFDLNEEVERELEEEESRTLQNWSSGIAEASEQIEDVFKDCPLQQRELHIFDQESSTMGSGPSKDSSCAVSPGSISCPDTDSGSSTKHPWSRPSVPRLKLPKSVYKGRQDVSAESSFDLEVLPSTTSTQESKGRLSSLIELHEIGNAERNNKTWGFGASYETERMRRRIYRHPGLHALLLELFVTLMLNIQGTLEACYSDRFPMENRKLNAPFFLSYHLNHTANSYLLPCLSKRMKEFKPEAFRILKLTWRALFSSIVYTNRNRIAHGAFAQVYTASVKRQSSDDEECVVLKVVDLPKGPYDPCRFFDVFSEVEILERFVGEPRVCQILDYGVDTESFILVLKHYKCSLRVWRQHHDGNVSTAESRGDGAQERLFFRTLPLYLEVYSAVLQAVKVLEIENVVHYDLKCDNILLEPVDSCCPESEFWNPAWPPKNNSTSLPFRVCIADFGQSKASMYLGGECTVRNRGTEYVKSPEMLKLLSSQPKTGLDFNVRQADEAVGKAVDVWSLGCLLYELLTGEHLLYDEDWLRFYIRVTVPSEELIPEEKSAKLHNYGPVLDLLRFILVRDPLQRPTLDDLAICLEQLQLKVRGLKPLDDKSNCNGIPTEEQICPDDDESKMDNPPSSKNTDDNVVQEKMMEQKPLKVRGCLMCLSQLLCHCECMQGE